MKAEELARKAFNDMHDNENSWEVYIKAMKEYANDQVEKDRERVKSELCTGVNRYFIGEEMDLVPIILD